MEHGDLKQADRKKDAFLARNKGRKSKLYQLLCRKITFQKLYQNCVAELEMHWSHGDLNPKFHHAMVA
jgi:hypothetical protein